MKVKYVFLFAFALLFVTSVSAQKVLDKPFQKWSKDDAQKLLSSSPWAHSYQSGQAQADIDKEAMLKEQDNTRSAAPGPRATDARAQTKDISSPLINIRLHSSLVIREAYVRLQQLSAGYDKMDDAKKADFDAKNKDLIDCPFCKNYYIVTMNKAIDSSHQSVEEGLFQTMSAAQMKGNIWLVNENGVKAELAQFLPPKGGADMAVFFFPRRDKEGKELISPDSKKFSVVFNGEFFVTSNQYAKMIPRTFEFDVDKLLMGHDLLF